MYNPKTKKYEHRCSRKILYVQDNPPEFCGSYEQALNEMKNGRKSSHWIWYIFPQIQGLGHSEMNRRYSLYGRSDVLEYWANPTLQARMRDILNVILESKVGIMNLMGNQVDAQKFRSCMTLFYCVTRDEIFEKAINKCCWGSFCDRTKQILSSHGKPQQQ